MAARPIVNLVKKYGWDAANLLMVRMAFCKSVDWKRVSKKGTNTSRQSIFKSISEEIVSERRLWMNEKACKEVTRRKSQERELFTSYTHQSASIF